MTIHSPLLRPSLHRADHVGRLLPPEIVRQAHYYRFREDKLRETEDEAITRLVCLQRRAGLATFTDGQIRRSAHRHDFIAGLTGVDIRFPDLTDDWRVRTAPIPHLTGQMGFPDNHPMVADFAFLAAQLRPRDGRAKLVLPAPMSLHFETEPTRISHPPYRDHDRLFDDIIRVWRKALMAFYTAGCRHLQFDDIHMARLAHPALRAMNMAMRHDPDVLLPRHAQMIEDIIHDRPADMIVGLHMCRGDFTATVPVHGQMDVALDAFFNMTSLDLHLLEQDADSPIGLEALRLLPAGNCRVMLGLIDSRSRKLESIDTLQRQIETAARYTNPAQLGISTRCGFGTSEHGDAITEDDQKRKLDLVVRGAQAIWGEH